MINSKLNATEAAGFEIQHFPHDHSRNREMAEFRLECWNKMNGTCETKKDWKLSKVLELCEGCGDINKLSSRLKTFVLIGNYVS